MKFIIIFYFQVQLLNGNDVVLINRPSSSGPKNVPQRGNHHQVLNQNVILQHQQQYNQHQHPSQHHHLQQSQQQAQQQLRVVSTVFII